MGEKAIKMSVGKSKSDLVILTKLKMFSGKLLIVLVVYAFSQVVFAQTEGGGAIQAIEQASEGLGGGTSKTSPTYTKTAPKKNGTTRKRSTRTSPEIAKKATKKSKPRPVKPYDGFIIGDEYTFMNFGVVSGPKPIYTIAAKNAGASGLVQVEILIGGDGTVLTARARSGNKLLYPEAEKAALETVFDKPVVYGKPARATGFLVYRFGKRED